jgi:succinate dehydrogenase / fumarate reductase cytochrome b subunit
MSAVAAPASIARVARFYESTVGKKAVMAITGVLLFGFVVTHLLGNLQFYLGREALDAYGASLRHLGPLLWVARGVLLIAVMAHLFSALQLWKANSAARPVAYQKHTPVSSSYASRTMMISGPMLFLFIFFHLRHLTFGPDLKHYPDTGYPMVYDNVVAGFSDPIAVGIYVLAMLFLGSHLLHGVWSMFQSLGFSHPKYTPKLRMLATVIAALIVIGNISIPLSVLLGFHQ